jgi:hypothetical protein
MNKPELEFILLRSPRTDEQGNKIPVTVSMVRASETDLTGYTFLSNWKTYEEWVPTKELDLYQQFSELKNERANQ